MSRERRLRAYRNTGTFSVPELPWGQGRTEYPSVWNTRHILQPYLLAERKSCAFPGAIPKDLAATPPPSPNCKERRHSRKEFFKLTEKHSFSARRYCHSRSSVREANALSLAQRAVPMSRERNVWSRPHRISERVEYAASVTILS